MRIHYWVDERFPDQTCFGKAERLHVSRIVHPSTPVIEVPVLLRQEYYVDFEVSDRLLQ